MLEVPYSAKFLRISWVAILHKINWLSVSSHSANIACATKMLLEANPRNISASKISRYTVSVSTTIMVDHFLTQAFAPFPIHSEVYDSVCVCVYTATTAQGSIKCK